MHDAHVCDLNDKISIATVKPQGRVTEAKAMDKTCDQAKTELMFNPAIARSHAHMQYKVEQPPFIHRWGADDTAMTDKCLFMAFIFDSYI